MDEQKLSRAKAKLLVDYPYFGTLASKLEVVVNDDIEAFKSNGVKLEINSDYFDGLELSEVAFVFANGAMHASLAHEQRRQKRSGWLWQMATDMAINDMLVQNGLDMPYGAQYRKRFAGMYAEEIYAELKADILRDDEDLEYEADTLDDVEEKKEQEKEQPTPEQLQEEILAEQLFAQEALNALQEKIQAEEVPESIERFFSISNFGKIDWRDELRLALDRYFRDDYVMMPPSKKLLYEGIYLPSCSSQTFRLVIAIDSSGSVDESLLNTFLTEVNFLMNIIPNYVIELIICDEKVRSHQRFFTGEPLDVTLMGGTGTDFRPVFTFIEKEFDDVKLLLYFTDLEGIFPKEVPNYAVKWIVPEQKEPPFGEIITLSY